MSKRRSTIELRNYIGTPAPIRTEKTAPFERADFTNLSIGAYKNTLLLSRQRRLHYMTYRMFLYGPAWGNRTPILSLEDSCPIHWTNARKKKNLVRVEGLEPSIPKASDFKSDVYADSTTLAFVSLCMYYIFFTASCQMILVLLVRFELTLSATSTLCVYQLRHKSKLIL